MEDEWSPKEKKSIWNRLLPILGFIVLFLIIKTFIGLFNRHNDEEFAFLATLVLFSGVYAGQYIGLLWTSRKESTQNSLFLILPILTLGGLFFTFLFTSGLVHHPNDTFFLSMLSLSMIIFSLSLGILVKLIRTRIERQLHTAQSQASHSEGELRLLQSQLSPHFLFNTLNNMYGISLTQSEKIPNLLLRLAELLRYSVYDTKALFVPLRDELTYIKNYVEFEKIRMGNKLILSQDLDEIGIDHLRIAPMLLIVFIENAFKHSKNSLDQHIFIDIALKQWGHSVLFSVKNTRGPINELNALSPQPGGLGLPNVWRRLELLYPNKYDLNIHEEENSYHVLLRLNL